MPIGELHKKKKAKNLAILGGVMAWIALIWIITMVKMTG